MTSCALCGSAVDPRTALVWRKDGYDVVRCPSCGLVFRAELPDESALRDIYDEGYFRDRPGRADRHGYADYLRDARLHRANARRRLRLLTGRPRGRLLDVGCAAGFFVDEARRAGWDASGIDVSEAMVDWARSNLRVPVVCASFTSAELALPPLDAITMWDYIEHSIDPRRDLAAAREQLRPGGLLALSTGDIGAITSRLAGRRWHLLTPEHHNFFFDGRTLRRLLHETGFDVLDARHRASVYSLTHALYKLVAPMPGTVRRVARDIGGSSLGSIAIPINLYDIVTVVARRR
ncbi:MAG TPA: class I SAM-dependent methyltransferase [Gaiellaceae bacterium]|nr:class I SAM-dependent methyltransferase [Gaiellaceae bacterium]